MFKEVDNRDRIWTSPDDMATEFEVRTFIFGLVCLIKPEVCVETGCYTGLMTHAIASGLSHNGLGHLWSCDISSERGMETEEMLRKDELNSLVTVAIHPGAAFILNVISPKSVDFAFLDSGGDRMDEFLALAEDKLASNAIIALHDSKRSREQKIIKTAQSWGFSIIQFDTPRGIALLKATS